MRSREAKIVILGSGMAGFGAAYRLHSEGIKSVMYEKNSYHGGHTTSFKRDGFIFDDGPHISFTKNKLLQELFAKSVHYEYETIHARVNNYWKGHWIKHPAQNNLHGLPPDIVVDIIADFIAVQNDGYGENKNYKDWLYASFGKTFAELFPMQYGFKFHTTAAHNMSTEWVGPRLYKPDLKEVLHGALSPTTPDVHYVDEFRYPSHGGFISYLNLFLEMVEMHLDHEVIRINPQTKKLTFRNGSTTSYDYLISSIALPELIARLKGTPVDVIKASRRLACTTCIVVNIGIDRQDISEAHWTYFYDDDFIFSRLFFPHMQSPHNVPEGKGAIQAEIYFSNKYKPLDRTPEEFIPIVIDDLTRCGLLCEDEKIVFSEARIISYANIIFDLERQPSLSIIHGYLDDIGILYCGRYGRWGYHWTDESFTNGEQAAQKIIDGNI